MSVLLKIFFLGKYFFLLNREGREQRTKNVWTNCNFHIHYPIFNWNSNNVLCCVLCSNGIFVLINVSNNFHTNDCTTNQVQYTQNHIFYFFVILHTFRTTIPISYEHNCYLSCCCSSLHLQLVIKIINPENVT